MDEKEGADYKLGLMGFQGEYDLYSARVAEFSAAERYDINLQRKHLKTL